MNNITLGSYIPIKSIIHDIDPRAKIICMMLLMISIFLPTGYIGYSILGGLVIAIVFMSNLKVTYILKAMRPMMFMLIFLMIINILVVKTGRVLVDLNGFKIYGDAIFQTLYIVIRLALMISITTILTATTKPLDLTLGIEDLLTPFKRIGVPAHIIAMMISIALRFIPTLLEETQRIMKAQASRGVDFDEGKLLEKIKGISSLIIPLFISALQKAEDLANAMEARGYVPDKDRTRYKQLRLRGHDVVAMGCACTLLVSFVFMVIL